MKKLNFLSLVSSKLITKVAINLIKKSELVPLREAARMLGISSSTLYRYDKAGLLKAYRTVGGHRRYLINELISFLEKMSNGSFLNRRSASHLTLKKKETLK